jgi:hypothetical protein
MKVHTLLPWIAILATSCESPPTGRVISPKGNTTSQHAASIPLQPFLQSNIPPPQAPEKKTIFVEILSEPEGSRIEVNDEYVGKTPCTVEVPYHQDGRFRERTIINALPVGFGYTQTKVFLGYQGRDSTFWVSNKIPKTIFFDMRLRPAVQNLNINLNN